MWSRCSTPSRSIDLDLFPPVTETELEELALLALVVLMSVSVAIGSASSECNLLLPSKGDPSTEEVFVEEVGMGEMPTNIP